DGIRDRNVTGVQTCALPISATTNKAVKLIATASTTGAQLMVFPEAFLGTYPKGLTFGSPVGKRTARGRSEYERYKRGSVDLEGRSEERRVGKESGREGWSGQ